MLSEVIQSRHSYRAIHLAVELVHQRSVHFGPLVTFSPISRSADYIFILFRISKGGCRRITSISLSLLKETFQRYASPSRYKIGTSRYGVKSKILYNSLFVFFFL